MGYLQVYEYLQVRCRAGVGLWWFVVGNFGVVVLVVGEAVVMVGWFMALMMIAPNPQDT